MQTNTTTTTNTLATTTTTTMRDCIAAYAEARIEQRGMRKRVQRLRSLRKTGEAFETTFQMLEGYECALAIEEKKEEEKAGGGTAAVVVRFWTTYEGMQALKPRLVRALQKGWASRGVHKKRSAGAFVRSFTPRFASLSRMADGHLLCRKLVLDEAKLAEYRQTPEGERLFLETVIEPMLATLDAGDNMSDADEDAAAAADEQ
jgi:hypothetical protein